MLRWMPLPGALTFLVCCWRWVQGGWVL